MPFRQWTSQALSSQPATVAIFSVDLMPTLSLFMEMSQKPIRMETSCGAKDI